jgi:hypothetical protein
MYRMKHQRLAQTKIKGTTMIRKYFTPALMAAVLLTGCQAPQGKFSQEQVAAMKSYGFTKAMATGLWVCPTASCLIKTTTICAAIVRKSRKWPLAGVYRDYARAVRRAHR